MDQTEKRANGGEPAERPASFWGFLKRLYAEFSEDRILTVAGGITFFVLLALFPAIASVVSLYGLFGHRAAIVRDLELVSGFLPGGAVAILKAELQRLIAQKPGQLSLAFAGSSLVALWSASGGFGAVIEALNVAYGVRETRSFLRLTIEVLVFTIVAICVVGVALALGLFIPDSVAQMPDGREVAAAFRILVWPLSFVICVLILDVIYRYGPDRKHAQWRWINWGSAIASVLWLLGTELFSWYVQNFGSYNRVYGELGAAVGFLTWIWLSLVIMLVGAEINSELEKRDSPKRVAET
ncbi:MAG TPA: YihY/virulence factor BrkB family protein [Rhizomicrobium sp.]|jgi:membrane protein|nr:YihY/virulence factor BrkB family protein [Rhizomicrobium sp.]